MSNQTEAPPPSLRDGAPVYYASGRRRKDTAVWRGADGQWRGFRGSRQTDPYPTRQEALAAALMLPA
jgi:hypothetical protein